MALIVSIARCVCRETQLREENSLQARILDDGYQTVSVLRSGHFNVQYGFVRQCGIPPPFFAFPTFDHIFSLNIIVMFQLCQTPMLRTQVLRVSVNCHPARKSLAVTVSVHVTQLRKLLAVSSSKTARCAPSGFSQLFLELSTTWPLFTHLFLVFCLLLRCVSLQYYF